MPLPLIPLAIAAGSSVVGLLTGLFAGDALDNARKAMVDVAVILVICLIVFVMLRKWGYL
ncbi:hypothetical protein AAOGI_06560 [Agarivorans albus]